MLKPFSKKFQVRNGAQKWRFWGKIGVKALDFGFATPKSTSLRGTTSFDVFCVKIGARVSAVAFFKNKKIAESLCAEGREITHSLDGNP